MADLNREQELARAAEELHGATTELREMMSSVLRNLQMEEGEGDSASIGHPVGRARVYGGSEQPAPKLPLISGGNDPTLAERFEDELHGSWST